ncbi:hypothetical protein ACTA71_012435 [Dictyostelium dimigraforme]
MPSDLVITIKNNDGESKISGKAITLPTLKIFPPPCCILFIEYKSEGKVWEKEQFDVNSGTIVLNGQEYDLVHSHGSWSKDNHNSNQISINIVPKEIPKKELPFFN